MTLWLNNLCYLFISASFQLNDTPLCGVFSNHELRELVPLYNRRFADCSVMRSFSCMFIRTTTSTEHVTNLHRHLLTTTQRLKMCNLNKTFIPNIWLWKQKFISHPTKNGGMMFNLWVVTGQSIKLLNLPDPLYFASRCFVVERIVCRLKWKEMESCLEFMLNIGKGLDFYNKHSTIQI